MILSILHKQLKDKEKQQFAEIAANVIDDLADFCKVFAGKSSLYSICERKFEYKDDFPAKTLQKSSLYSICERKFGRLSDFGGKEMILSSERGHSCPQCRESGIKTCRILLICSDILNAHAFMRTGMSAFPFGVRILAGFL